MYLHNPCENNAKFLKFNSESVKILYSIREPHQLSPISHYKHVARNEKNKKFF